jgi:arylesterase/paraoxonase
MQRLRRSLYLLAFSLGVSVIALIFRSLTGLGVFTEVTPQFQGNCVALHGVIGPEDMQIDRKDRLVFVSATDRRALEKKAPNAQDGLYTFPLDHPEQGFTKLTGTPSNFHPHGISLYRDGGGALTLMAVDHPLGEDSAVEIFDVKIANGKAALVQRADIAGGLLVNPNDVTAVAPDQFYVTNDHASKSAFGRTLEDALLLPRANVVFFDGNVFRVVANGLSFANGIFVSPDDTHVYVASTTGRTIHTYERNPVSGELKDAGEFDIPSGLDNIDIDAQGNLWVAGHPKLLDMQAVRADPTKVTPSQIFEVTLKNGVPSEAKLVYANAGDEISGSSIGVVDGDRLFIGAGYDSKVLACTAR